MNVLLSIFFSLIGILAYSQTNADDILGKWKDCQNRATFEVYKIDNQYFAKIIGLTKPTNEKGEELLDRNNPDKKLRNNKIVGLDILTGLIFNSKENYWEGGTAYDPEMGMHASCKVLMPTKNELDIKASKYFITQTRKWNRYE